LLTTEGSLLKHSREILNLLKAVFLPKQIVVIHCPGHKGQRIRLLREIRTDVVAQEALCSGSSVVGTVPPSF
jgi:hypothetical protein